MRNQKKSEKETNQPKKKPRGSINLIFWFSLIFSTLWTKVKSTFIGPNSYALCLHQTTTWKKKARLSFCFRDFISCPYPRFFLFSFLLLLLLFPQSHICIYIYIYIHIHINTQEELQKQQKGTKMTNIITLNSGCSPRTLPLHKSVLPVTHPKKIQQINAQSFQHNLMFSLQLRNRRPQAVGTR